VRQTAAVRILNAMSSVQNNGASCRIGGVTGAGFRPGQSGNPGGRPRGLARTAREVVGDDGRAIIDFWMSVMSDRAASMRDRLEASRLLADRGWGKASAFEQLEADYPKQTLDAEEAIHRAFEAEMKRLAPRPAP
jgi:Family of unknown function (DUF5681)